MLRRIKRIIEEIRKIIKEAEAKEAEVKAMRAKKIVEPENYGEGVYYFPVTGERFGRSLASFCKGKKVKVLSAVANFSGCVDWSCVGYFAYMQFEE